MQRFCSTYRRRRLSGLRGRESKRKTKICARKIIGSIKMILYDQATNTQLIAKRKQLFDELPGRRRNQSKMNFKSFYADTGFGTKYVILPNESL